jgi:hypothetical protein
VRPNTRDVSKPFRSSDLPNLRRVNPSKTRGSLIQIIARSQGSAFSEIAGGQPVGQPEMEGTNQPKDDRTGFSKGFPFPPPPEPQRVMISRHNTHTRGRRPVTVALRVPRPAAPHGDQEGGRPQIARGM